MANMKQLIDRLQKATSESNDSEVNEILEQLADNMSLNETCLPIWNMLVGSMLKSNSPEIGIIIVEVLIPIVNTLEEKLDGKELAFAKFNVVRTLHSIVTSKISMVKMSGSPMEKPGEGTMH